MNRNVKTLVMQFGNLSPPYGNGDTPLEFVPKIIAELRKYWKEVARDEDGEKVIYNVPVLRATSDPDWMLEIVAEYTVTMAGDVVEHRSISVMMLTDTMYVIGFKGSKFKQYWELREGNVFMQLIGGSKDLFMNGSYTSGSTIGTASRVKVGGVLCSFRERVVVNRENTFFYFNILYFYNGEDVKRTFMARALVYVIHLFAETARLADVKNYVTRQWWKPLIQEVDDIPEQEEKGGEGTPDAGIALSFSTYLVNLINDWKKISAEIQLPVPDPKRVHMLGIAKFYDETMDDEKSSSKDTGSSKKEKGKGKWQEQEQGKGKGKGKGKA